MIDIYSIIIIAAFSFVSILCFRYVNKQNGGINISSSFWGKTEIRDIKISSQAPQEGLHAKGAHLAGWVSAIIALVMAAREFLK